VTGDADADLTVGRDLRSQDDLSAQGDGARADTTRSTWTTPS
jgi:hypothetical protein